MDLRRSEHGEDTQHEQESWEELVRNANRTIPDPVGFEPFETVKIETRYLDKTTNALNPDLDVGELVLTSHETWEEHRFRVTMPDTVTDEFYKWLEMYKKVSPEQFGVDRA